MERRRGTLENVVADPKFWRGKRVFLTGHTGFKGTWLGVWLRALGADVHGFALAPLTPSLHQQIGAEGDFSSTISDIRDARAVTDALRATDPQIVFHLAAQPLVRASYTVPVDTFAVNVMGTAHLLAAATAAPRLRAVVVVTTDKVYDNDESGRPFRETDRLGGYDPYSASKACVELLCQSWRRSFAGRVPWVIATARAGNVIGGGDWAHDRLIPDMVRNAMNRRVTPIRNPQSVRPWQHVLDPLAGYLRLAEELWARGTAVAEAWNFGPAGDSEVSVREVADLVCSEWGDGCCWTHDPSVHPHESRALSLDSVRARSHLNWRPRLGIEEAVRWTVKWYRAFADGESPRRVTLDQIAAYETLA